MLLTSRLARAAGLLLLLSVTACSSPSADSVARQPGWDKGAMVTAANPHATAAGMAMLRRGGHAVDAAIAAHAVLGLVEPQSSGIGGGAFMLVYQREQQDLVLHDGREMAPAGATPDMFMAGAEVMPFLEAWQGGVAIGVPGAIALYADTHAKYGKLPWAELFEPAIKLATEGFVVSPRMAGFLPRMAELSRLDDNPGAAAYFYPGGEPLKAGDLRKNPAYADTLSRVASEGKSAFYTGPLAQAMVAAAGAQPNPGSLSLEDLAAYRTVDRPSLCGPYQQLRVCAGAPPSSGISQVMMMGIYQELAANAGSMDDRVAAFVDAQRLVYADRDHFVGDPDHVDVPVEQLLDPAYLEHRASERFAPGATPEHGDPLGFAAGKSMAGIWSRDRSGEVPGTTHLSVIDSEGNAVSMTATVEAPFGSSRWVGGFLLNNQMTDFAREFNPGEQPQANAIAPHKRPRSSMSPVMVFDPQGQLLLVSGSPGGNNIPAYVFKSLVGVLDWGMTPEAAVAFPNITARGEKVRVEVNVEPGPQIAGALKARGYNVQEREGENSGLHMILVSGDTLQGAADPRREGKVEYLAPAP
ncbi:gamma-glutamyltransferase [Seongchinamella sediminis]|uniref:Glutathione hydrolase proenzyme n=1 Tax=Seongchinamella sediminis TaxID=2283635 RepID=A0A3L7DSE1_9GAMM|nr:gamma-glutamyltransferase [Seongchinamella sediminis]RLQ20577.1 gamma-glutamyltransferase [Seongchinamella sediminis]